MTQEYHPDPAWLEGIDVSLLPDAPEVIIPNFEWKPIPKGFNRDAKENMYTWEDMIEVASIDAAEVKTINIFLDLSINQHCMKDERFTVEY